LIDQFDLGFPQGKMTSTIGEENLLTCLSSVNGKSDYDRTSNGRPHDSHSIIILKSLLLFSLQTPSGTRAGNLLEGDSTPPPLLLGGPPASIGKVSGGVRCSSQDKKDNSLYREVFHSRFDLFNMSVSGTSAAIIPTS